MRWLLRVALGLLSLVAGLLVVLLGASFVFNIVTNGATKPVTALWKGKFIDAGGVLTAYREWGHHGSPIVLIGGFVEPTFVWDEVAPILAAGGHRVFAFDLDGFGYTKRHGPYTLAEWTDQTEAFMKAVGIRKPVVVGHSLGAAVAVSVARRGLASRIVLVDGDALSTGGPPHLLRTIVGHTPFVTTVLRLATMWDKPVELILRNAFGPRHPTIDHAMVEIWTNQFHADGADSAMAEIIDHGVQGYTLAELRSFHLQATVIWGTKDAVDSPASGRAAARALNARFVIVPGAGHLDLLTNPVSVARSIERPGGSG